MTGHVSFSLWSLRESIKELTSLKENLKGLALLLQEFEERTGSQKSYINVSVAALQDGLECVFVCTVCVSTSVHLCEATWSPELLSSFMNPLV